MTSVYEVLRRPIITEKSSYLSSKLGQYVFEVNRQATKNEIKQAVETLFDVSVVRVNILNVPARRTRRPRSRRVLVRRSGIKKAVVTLAEGQRLPVFEGVK
jgi:large subunit ribosomal protein L23